MEKSKRKIEGDLRVSQEAAAEIERSKAELSQSIQRKDREFGAIMAKIEDEASLGSKQQKQIKELAVSQKKYFFLSIHSLVNEIRAVNVLFSGETIVIELSSYH